MALRTIVCDECGRPFEAVRQDAECCSRRCRVRRHRARVEARQAAEAERLAGLLAALRAVAESLPAD